MEQSTQVSIFLLQRIPLSLPKTPLFATPYWLADADQRRYAAMRSRKRRSEFLLGRLLLRYALQQCYGKASDRWRLVAPAGGAPRLEVDSIDHSPPTISIAHSRGLVVCAVAALPRLGVDVENYQKRKIHLAEISSATFHSLELAEMARLPEAERKDYFFRCWTLKEALAKALGIGLAMPFRNFGFTDCRLAESPENWDAKSESWGFANLPVEADVALGLAWATKAKNHLVTLSLQSVDFRQVLNLIKNSSFAIAP